MSLLQYFTYFIVGQIALTMAFYMLSLVVPKAAFVARALASYMALVFSASFGAVISIFMRLVGQQGSAQWAAGRVFKYIMAATTGVTFEIIDPKHHLDNIRPAVFVGNHQTELDVLMLGSMFPRHCSITAKKSLKSWPVLGWFMTLSGSVFIDRKNTTDARQAMSGAAKEIRDRRQSVYMFPEGTRSYSKEPMLLPFKKGAFHLAVQAGVPIVPVVSANYSHVLYFKKFVFSAGRIPGQG
jgi:lysophosphatidate acyltransferase